MQLYSGEFEKSLVGQIQLQDQKEYALTAMKAVSAHHRFGASVICRMKFKGSNKLRLLQIYSLYPIFTSAGLLVSNPNLTTLDRRGR